MSLLERSHLRHLWRDRWQVVLAVFGVAIGVAVVLAVDLANASSREAMRIATERLDGTATHTITGPGERLAESHYPELRRRWREGDPLLAGVRAMAPVVTGEARLRRRDGDVAWPVALIGVDPTADAGMRAVAPGVGGLGGRLISEPGTVILDADSARRLGIEAVADGDRTAILEVLTRGGTHRVRVLDTFVLADRQLLGQGLMLADIATAQELLDRVGTLSRIDLLRPRTAPRGHAGRLLERIFPGLVVMPDAVGSVPVGDGLRLESLAERAADTRALAASFQLNLAALGLLALLVGLFLVHGTLAYAVLRRQKQFGRLRALGVRPAELYRMVLAEAMVLAVLGTALGLLLGRWLAGGLLGLMAGTLEGLYSQVAVAALAPDPVPPLKAALVGLGGTLLAALPAAGRAAAAPPRLLLGGNLFERPPLRRRLPLLLGLLAAGAFCLLPFTGYFGGLLAVAAVLLAGALITPAFIAFLLGGLARWAGRAPLAVRMLMREAVRGLSRSGVAAAALVVAIATAIGMGLMVESFRVSVDQWLDARLAAPLHLQLAGERDRVPAELAAALDDHPVAGHVTRITWPDRIEGHPVRVTRFAEHGDVPADLGLSMLSGARAPGGVLLSEPLARRLDRSVGMTLAVPAAGGDRVLPISGVFREYGAGPGLLMVPAETDVPALPGTLGVEVYAVPGTGPEELIEALTAAAGVDTRLRRNDELLALARGVFDRTFRITGVLQSIAGLVAAFGLFAALTALGLERRVVYGMLRTVGVGRSGPAWQNVGEAVLLAGAAALLALPLGVVVALILVEVVNVRAFDWTLDIHLPPGLFLQALGIALLAGVVAALGPAVSLWRMPAATMLAESRAYA